MIRFRCSDCGREYVLPDALAHLPLLCKGCGHRLNVPDPQPDPEPETSPQSKPATAPSLPPAPADPVVSPAERKDAFLSSDTLAQLELPAEKDATTPPIAPEEQPIPSVASAANHRPEFQWPSDDGKVNRSRWILARLADAAVVLILLAVGVLVGEMVVRKPTGTILREAGSAPKFPPIDLLLWLGCVAFFPLVYAWLGTRGWTLGAWLQRRGK